MKVFIILILFVLTLETLMAQEHGIAITKPGKPEGKDTVGIEFSYPGKKTKLLNSMIAPVILIGLGISSMNNHGIYSSYQAQIDIQNLFGHDHSHVDDYLVFSPYLEFGLLLLLKVQCKNDMVNTLLLIGKAEVIQLALVIPIKYITHVERPDGSNAQSFPSGHTAQAFMAATIVYREFRYKSPWYGIGAYALASATGAYRMINNKHWESDVLVGAGIGILSANLSYATHVYRWGRKEVCFTPIYDTHNKGLAITMRF